MGDCVQPGLIKPQQASAYKKFIPKAERYARLYAINKAQSHGQELKSQQINKLSDGVLTSDEYYDAFTFVTQNRIMQTFDNGLGATEAALPMLQKLGAIGRTMTNANGWYGFDPISSEMIDAYLVSSDSETNCTLVVPLPDDGVASR